MAFRAGCLVLLVAVLAWVPAVASGHELQRERQSMAAMPAFPAASAPEDAPDLRITMPSGAYAGQVAPVYVDAFERPGRLLYRFDAIIHNTGGALDLYGGKDEVTQAIWPGGEPTTVPRPDARPPSGEVVQSDRDAAGARFAYVFEDTHEHWHFFSAARYSLLVPDASARVSDKVGFCMYDSFGTEGGGEWWFPWDAPGPDSWCNFNRPSSAFVRMGLSPGATDRYSSQREFQYVDVTGLAPGAYTLRAEANPEGHLVEGDPTDNVHEERRLVPGVRASGTAAAGEPGQPLAVPLPAEVVAPEIPARSGPCRPRLDSADCYVWAEEEPVEFTVTAQPEHGTVTLDGSRATYTPAPGFEGTDRFTYTATDARGLTSAPAAAELRVQRPAPAEGQATAPADTGGQGSAPASAVSTAGEQASQPRPPRRRLARIGKVRRTRKALVVSLHCRRTATGACRGTLTAKAARRRIARRTFRAIAPGRTAKVRLRLSRKLPRRRIVLTASVRDADARGLPARRTVTVSR